MTASTAWGTGDATFQAVGGRAGVTQLVDRFYELMGTNPDYKVIWDMHPPDRAMSRDKLTRFLCAWMGGPRLYKEKYGAISIPGVHAHLAITEAEKAQWLSCMNEALHTQGFDHPLIDYLLTQLAVPAGRIVSASSAAAARHSAHLPWQSANSTPRLKICCIASIEEAQLAVKYGAHAVGFVAEMPSGPGTITDAEIRTIAAAVPPGVDTFLLTSRTTAETIADHVRYCGCSTVQIVQQIPPAEVEKLAALLPGIRRVQVIHVEGEEALEEIGRYEAHVHAFLLDSGRPNQAIPEFGGTGRAHDWNISAEFVKHSKKPVFLAGGLNPDNVREAVNRVAPYGLDLCSGIRTKNAKSDRALDEVKLAAYVQNAQPLKDHQEINQ